jgi:hypothetical protein
MAVVPLASSAGAQEADCPPGWGADYIFSIFPPTYPVLDGLVVLGEGTITIRGDEGAAYLASLPGHYTSSTERFLACVNQQFVGPLVLDRVTPVIECVDVTIASLVSDPDLLSRYVQVGADLVVTIDYGQALDDVVAIAANCTAS